MQPSNCRKINVKKERKQERERKKERERERKRQREGERERERERKKERETNKHCDFFIFTLNLLFAFSIESVPSSQGLFSVGAP